MGCTIPGIIACIFSLVALAISASSLGLPLWSMRTIDEENATLMQQISNRFTYQSDFGVGVWGVCEDTAQYNANLTSEANLHTCHMYYSSYRLETATFNASSNIVFKNSTESLCQNYNDIVIASSMMNSGSPNVTVKSFPRGLLILLNANSSSSSFLDKTCGGLGKFTLALMCLQLIFGVLMCTLVILGVTCCKTASIMVSFSGILGFLASLFAFIAFIAWIAQVQPIMSSGMTYGLSFGFDIVAMILYLIAAMACFKHVRRGENSEAAREISMTNQRAPISMGKRSNLV